MFLEGEPPSENPVSAEDIVGIHKDVPAENTDEKRNSLDRKIPKEIQEAFGTFIETNLTRKDQPYYSDDEEESDPSNLFFATKTNDGNIQRRYFRYSEDQQDVLEDTKFSDQNSLFLTPIGYLAIYKADVLPDSRRGFFQGYDSDDATLLRVDPDLSLDFTRILDDQTLVLRYTPETKISYITFHKIKNITSLKDMLANPALSYVPQESKELPTFALGITPSSVGVALYSEGASHIETVDLVKDYSIDGRRVQIANAGDSVKLVFYDRGDPAKVDYEISIPKEQAIEEVWTRDMKQKKPEKRYVWEKDLVPEPLRTDLKAPRDLDEDWKRASLAETIGIKIERNLAA